MISFLVQQLDNFGYWIKRCEFEAKQENEAFNHFHYLCNEFPTMQFRLIKIQTAVIASY